MRSRASQLCNRRKNSSRISSGKFCDVPVASLDCVQPRDPWKLRPGRQAVVVDVWSCFRHRGAHMSHPRRECEDAAT